MQFCSGVAMNGTMRTDICISSLALMSKVTLPTLSWRLSGFLLPNSEIVMSSFEQGCRSRAWASSSVTNDLCDPSYSKMLALTDLLWFLTLATSVLRRQ